MPEQLTLKILFDSVTPREVAGPVSSDRSQYQKDWALCRLLKAHLDGQDYLIAFDIHDDVIVFEPEDEPSTVCFYQVKTTNKDSWTLASLIRRGTGKGGLLPSILGNLYHNAKEFHVFTKRLTLVSNAPFKVALSQDGKKAEVLPNTETSFDKLPATNKKKISKAMRAEHALDAEPMLDGLLWFEHSDLPLTGHDTFAKGKLTEFFSQFKPNAKHNIPLIYRTLIDEIRRRNDYSKESLSFAEMRDKKGIGRSLFDDIIKVVAVDDGSEKALDRASAALAAEGVDFALRQGIRRSWQRVEAERTSAGNASFRKLVQHLSDLTIVELSTLSETVEAGLGLLKPKFGGELNFDDNFIRAVILMRLYEVL